MAPIVRGTSRNTGLPFWMSRSTSLTEHLPSRAARRTFGRLPSSTEARPGGVPGAGEVGHLGGLPRLDAVLDEPGVQVPE